MSIHFDRVEHFLGRIILLIYTVTIPFILWNTGTSLHTWSKRFFSSEDVMEEPVNFSSDALFFRRDDFFEEVIQEKVSYLPKCMKKEFFLMSIKRERGNASVKPPAAILEVFEKEGEDFIASCRGMDRARGPPESACCHVADLHVKELSFEEVEKPSEDVIYRELPIKEISYEEVEKPPLDAYADPPEEDVDTPSFIEKDRPPICCNYDNLSFLPKRIFISHVEGSEEGIGFATDYTTLGLLFAPDYRQASFLPMLDLRGHRFDDNTYAANVGLIGRYIPDGCCFCEILGFNMFYDYREGDQGDFNQLGFGIEILGPCRWDFRANAYVPLGVRERKMTCVFDDFEGGFEATNRKEEAIAFGFNAEISYIVIETCDFLLYAAGGPYYVAGKCHQRTLGGEFRLRPQYRDYLALDMRVSYDPVFKTLYQAEFIVSLPLYEIACQNNGPCGVSDLRIYQRVERFEVMPFGRCNCWKTNW